MAVEYFPIAAAAAAVGDSCSMAGDSCCRMLEESNYSQMAEGDMHALIALGSCSMMMMMMMREEDSYWKVVGGICCSWTERSKG